MQTSSRTLTSFVFLAAMAGFAGSLLAQVQEEAQMPKQTQANETVSKPITGKKIINPIEIQARKTWQKTMHHTPAPKPGCFQALFPSTQWQEVECAPRPAYRSAKPMRRFLKEGGHEEVGGDTYPSTDVVVQAPAGHLLSSALGSFPTVNGVTSESGIGVAAYSFAGILGANEYTLQINTNIGHTAACGTYASCTAWQQYVMSTNTPVSLTSTSLTNETEVFIEYWLFNYGPDNLSNHCPSGFVYAGADTEGSDCVQNTPATVVYSTGQLPITDLADVTLSGSATSGGTDSTTVTYSGNAYTATVADSLTDIASIWNQAEFNVVGNGGGSQAQFNNGTAVIAKVAVTDGSTLAPSCVTGAGTTGESNNLNFVPSTASPTCCPYGGADPSIEFMEVYDTAHTHTASCGSSSITGEPHVTTANDDYYNFQAAGEFIALQDADGAEIQTRQTPLPTVAPGDFDPSHLNDDGLVSCLAMNTAVAARVGSHRVTYEPGFSGAYGSAPYQLRIDGAVTALGSGGVNLGDGAVVKDGAAGGVEVDFPDGKIMTAIPSESYDNIQLLNVQFENLGILADSSLPAARGVSGAIPSGSWLPLLPNGTSVGAMPAALHQRYVTLYNTFGNAWRVNASNTLFDYAPGTSTATFTNAAWPVENAKSCAIPHQQVIRPVSLAIATEACRSVSDAKLHTSCLFDVQATGNTGFARTYQLTERTHILLNVKPIDFKLLTTEPKAAESNGATPNLVEPKAAQPMADEAKTDEVK